MIPEFANQFGSKYPYSGRYLRVKGKRYSWYLFFNVNMCVCVYSSHVIICGYITPYSLAPFLHDFLHKGRDEVDGLDVLIIDKYVRNILTKKDPSQLHIDFPSFVHVFLCFIIEIYLILKWKHYLIGIIRNYNTLSVVSCILAT
jgi:hypothetical protein